MTQSASSGDGRILSPETLASKIMEWKGNGFHVLSPAIQMSSFAQGYAVNASIVMLDPVTDSFGRGLDVYYDKRTMKEHERGLSKIGLGRIASACGTSWISQASGRRDPLTIQNFWIYQMLGVYLAYDGTPQTIQGEKEIDYRDGSAQIGGWTPAGWQQALKNKQTHIGGWSESRVMQARCNGAERAETGAMERAIRMGFGIKHVYTVQELAKPFVALRVCAIVDMQDPNVRAMVASSQLAGVAALYSGRAQQAEVRHERLGLPEAQPVERFEAPIQARQPEPVMRQTAQPAAQATQGEASVPQGSSPAVTPAQAPPAAVQPGPVSTALSRAVATLPKADNEFADLDDLDDAIEDQAPDGAVFLAEVKSELKPYSAKHKKHGQTFKKWTITIEGGESGSAVFPRIGEEAERCYESGLPVYIKIGPENQWHDREVLQLADATDGQRPSWMDVHTESAPQQVQQPVGAPRL